MNVWSWSEIKKEISNKRIVCYGAGNNAYSMLNNKEFCRYQNQIDFFVDADETKYGSKIETSKHTFFIEKVSEIERIKDDTVVIITISDYMSVANIFDDRNIKWFAWVDIARGIAFGQFEGVLQQQRKILLLNTPDYLNLGDHAITIGEQKLIADVFGERAYEFGSSLCNKEGIQQLKQYITPHDLIFIQGGGNMGSLWKTCEENIGTIISEFPDNKIIILPQSIYYEDTESGMEAYKKSRNIYSKHNNLLICCRDFNSYIFTKDSYTCKTMLLPDMVLYLDFIKTSKKRNGIGVLLRDDKEANLKKEEREELGRIVSRTGKKMKVLSHHKNEVYSCREERFRKMLEEYSSCELIITDRLHGMIFSVLTQTPCIVFDNSYKKISGLYNTWLTENKNINVHKEFDKGKVESQINSFIESSVNEVFSKDNIVAAFEILKDYCIDGGMTQ